MKRKNLFTLLAFILISGYSAMACTNFIISKGASKDGSTMITYSADSHVLYGELYYKPAADYSPGSMMDIYEWDTHKYLGKIKQALHTYSVVGNMNEFQLSIGETTFGGKDELQHQAGALVDYGSLIYLALQRSKTARQAIQTMGELVAEYGYYSEGESFSICDPNEVWILEMIGKGKDEKGAVWVALKIPDGYISGHANQARITTFPLNDPQNCLYAPDVISFARKKAWFNGEDKNFSFSDTYNPVSFDGARFCEARVWSGFNKVNKGMGKYLPYAMGYALQDRMPLWIKPDQKLSLQDVMELMRDHYEGTAMDMNKDLGAGPYSCGYRWRPLTWKVDSTSYFNERAISTQQTGFSFVAQSRSWLPNPIGGINWFGVDDTYSTVYTPLYCGITKIPHSFAEGYGSMMEFNDQAAFWIFNQVSNFAYTRYSDMIPEIRKKQKELEDKYYNLTQAVDASAAELYKNHPALAIEFISDFSVQQGENTCKVWKELYAYLFTKYMDGNIKEKDAINYNPKVKQPGYGSDWYRKIVKETGDKFKVPTEPKK